MSETRMKFAPGCYVPERPPINTGTRDLNLVSKKAQRLLEQTNHPREIFRHGNSIVRIERDDSGFSVQVLDEGRMRQTLAERLAWYERDKHGKHPARPPGDLSKDIIATPPNQWPFPILKRVTRRPVFTRDGGLIRTPGYNSETGIYYRPRKGFRLPTVPDRPSPEQLGRAKQLIQIELLGDFPFTGNDRAHAICVSLLPLVRDLIEGPTPLHTLEKPTPGTGASYLVQLLCYLACGSVPAAMTPPKDESEWRRTLFGKLLQAPEVIFLDNVSLLDSATLSSAITCDYFEDRIVGKSEFRRVPVHCLWLATANNPVMSPELVRRNIRIRMDAGVERPELRDKFRHPKLKKWVLENEAQLVWALLTIVQAWISEGRPPGSKPFGMFESWAEIMGGILDVAGIGGFLENISSNKAPDSESVLWSSLVERWWSEYKDEKVRAGDLFSIADEILDLGSGVDKSRRTIFGKALSKRKDCVFGRYTIRFAGTRQGAQVWKLEKITTKR